MLNFSSAMVLEPAGVGRAHRQLAPGQRPAAQRDGRPPWPRSGPRRRSIRRRACLASSLPASTAVGVTLSWLPPADAGQRHRYELEAGSAPGVGEPRSARPSAASPLAVAGVPAGTYYARLRSVGPGGRSAPTADVVIVVAPARRPGRSRSVPGRRPASCRWRGRHPAARRPSPTRIGAGGDAAAPLDRRGLPDGRGDRLRPWRRRRACTT